jgi:hypothetical protein
LQLAHFEQVGKSHQFNLMLVRVAALGALWPDISTAAPRCQVKIEMGLVVPIKIIFIAAMGLSAGGRFPIVVRMRRILNRAPKTEKPE